MAMKWNVGIFIIVFLMGFFLKCCGSLQSISWWWVFSPLLFSAFVFILEWLVDTTDNQEIHMLILIETSEDSKSCMYKGKLCRWAKSRVFGGCWVCILFNENGEFVKLERDYSTEDDQLMRCDQCLELEKAGEK